ncbi:MAG TPA: hypothetical protein VI914_06780 [Thermodesulfobacteriota bacterium]|nr:hypothetical protein [Thermodesulfobacteriota bacterium]
MNKKGILIFLLCLTAFFPSCARKKEREEKVATVNGAPILLMDFQREVFLASRRDPNLKTTHGALKELLQTDIDRKLMIQEAVRMGLSEDEHFAETIKKFWEQTLIRELINAKTREWSDRLFVTDDEVKKHYERMGYKVTVRTAAAENEKEAQEFKERMKKGEKVEGEKVLGPLLVEGIPMDSPLYNAFYLSTGYAGVMKGKDGYMIFLVVKKDSIQMPPLKEVYGRIKEALLEHKKERALMMWLDAVKGSARVEIDHNLLKSIANE